MMRSKLLELVDKTKSLPHYPKLVTRLERLLQDENCDRYQIAGLIKTAPVLTGIILNQANSAYYGGSISGMIVNLPDAISKLGFENIREIVISIELSNLFSDCVTTDPRQFWRHSLAVATFSQLLCHRVGSSEEEIEMCYLAGLMHDIGIMVFCQLIPDEYSKFISEVSSEEKLIDELEKDRFAIDHAELGAHFIKTKWVMDQKIINCVRHHHSPEADTSKSRRLTQLINIANGICSYSGMGNGIDVFQTIFNDNAWLDLGLTLDDAEDILEEVKTSIGHAEDLLKLN